MAGGSGGQAYNAGDPVFETSLYNPEAPAGRKWTNLARSQVARLYHSGIILLESGELVTMGSEMANYVDSNRPLCYPWGTQVCTDPYEYRIERFTPPYLLTGKPRPVIREAPQKLTYTSVFKIGLEQDLNINRVSFIRYSTTTHSTNTDQRLVELEILGQDSESLYLRAPRDGALAPPGNWMLFIMSDGVPSVAKTILMSDGPATYVEIPTDALPGTKTTSFSSPSPTNPNLQTNWGNSIDASTSLFLSSMLSVLAILFIGFAV
jgi:hypothetical protein